ncbi:MAG TPA: S9 family peptidase [Vicinamibacterales bacterium]|nr:S9 family peptidase [Vicinamibacterales bacterium]
MTKRGLFVAALLLAAASVDFAATAAQRGKRALTLENIVGRQAGARQAVLSPDGRRAAVTGDGPQGSGIYIVETTGASQPAYWTAGAAAAWFPDGVRVLILRDNDLWVGRVGSDEVTRITRDELDERAPRISPDGRTIAFYSTRSGHQDIWLVPADGSTAPQQLTSEAMAADDPRFAPAWSPDGRSIAYISNKANYWHDDVWVVDVASKRARQLSRSLMAMSTPAWSPDGRALAVLGNAKAGYWYEDLQDIWIVDVRNGSERTVRMQVHATDWLHSLPVYWSGDGRHLYFAYHERGDINVWSVPAEGGVATRVTHEQGALRSLETTPKADAFVYVRSGPTRGPEVHFLEVSGGVPRQLTAFSDEWESIQEPREVSYRSFDGLYIQGFLYLPPGMRDGARYPALVNVHGGGTNAYLRTLNLLEQYLASQGYVVLAINYRGGSGFGRAFQDLGVNDWATGQAHDAAVAADFLRSLPYVNGKVGIYGYSYGGIMSMATIARYPDKFDAAVPMAGIYDFADALTNADRLGKIFILTGHGGPPEQRREVYARSNTLARLQNVRTPLLIMHGEADVRAPFRQYELAVELLKKYGKTFESRSYPNEPHGFRNPANRLDMYRRLEAFLAKHLKSSS